MKIVLTGKYDSNYNRIQILLQGLKKKKNVTIVHYPIINVRNFDKIEFKKLISSADFIYLPPFSHESVRFIKKITNKPIVFDPLISKYLTKVYDYKQVFKYSPRAFKNYLKDKIALQSSDIILSDTNAHRKYFINKFNINPNSINVLPIGSDTQKFKPNKVKKSSYFNVGFYGGFIPLHGVKNIIKAAQILKNHIDIKFKLIGTGFEYEKIKKLSLKLNLKNVSFLGWIEYNDLPGKINELDLCLGIFGDSPKTDLVIPNKIYHYAALKKCIITKDTPAIKEIFTDKKDIILTDNSPESIAQKILDCKRDKNSILNISNSAYNLLIQHYNEKKIAERFLQILKNFNGTGD